MKDNAKEVMVLTASDLEKLADKISIRRRGYFVYVNLVEGGVYRLHKVNDSECTDDSKCVVNLMEEEPKELPLKISVKSKERTVTFVADISNIYAHDKIGRKKAIITEITNKKLVDSVKRVEKYKAEIAQKEV